AYLRQSVINRIRDEVRRVARRPAPVELSDNLAPTDASPPELAIQAEAYERYSAALTHLRPKDREMIVARIEAQWTIPEIADRFGVGNPAAARMAVSRAQQRLMTRIQEDAAGAGSQPT